jgi:ferrochelatase
MNGFDALVVLSFGGPEQAEDVVPFLERVTAGRGVPRERIDQVAEHYFAAGGVSPVNARCRDLVAALDAQLSVPVYWGNRNWHPLLEDTVARMRDDGVERALAFVTSAYGGYSSCRQYLDDIVAARAKVGPGAPEIQKLRLYFNHPGWAGPWERSLTRALDNCRSALAGRQQPPRPLVDVLFSAHSIPVPMATSSPYVDHVTETVRLVAGLAGLSDWRLVWQSRSGNPAVPWLGPDICEAIEGSLAPGLVVVPVGFTLENMEVVHDIDVEAAACARKRGAHFERAQTVSSDPAFVAMVRDLVHERLGLSAERSALGTLGPSPDACPEGHCPGRPGQRRGT